MSVSRISPYQRIVEQIRGRIEAGDLRPGDRVPSTRQIAAESGVAMATATKVLTTLRHEGLVEAVPGVGTVVRAPTRRTREHKPARGGLTVGEIIGSAIEIADAEGLMAVTMRRVAAALGVGVMSLYHHVPNRAELVRLMADAVFGQESLPEPGPDDWRARLETVARMHWQVYRRHPWVAAPAMTSAVHPPLLPSAIAQVDWQLRTLEGLGLTHLDMIRAVSTLNSFVGGMALSHAMEIEREQESGLSVEQRWAAAGVGFDELVDTGRYPTFANLTIDESAATDIDALFDFGLQRHLDGLATYVAKHEPRH